jgi:diaminopimelate decarboxylase
VHAILDAGVNIAEPVRGEYHQIFVAGPEPATQAAYRLVGPICTPMDTLAWSWRLPTLQQGSSLCIMDAGAYFVPFATSFSFPQPAAVMIDGSNVKVVRRAEQFEDLVRRDEER